MCSHFQIQILKTLMTGQPNYLMDLAAIRLASINQTLDPWLYILLRRSFFVRMCATVKRINFKCLVISHRESVESRDNKCDNAAANDGNVDNVHADNVNSGEQSIEHNHSRIVLEQPDVMQSAKNSNSNSSPLPDVTNTGSKSDNGDSGYVCHFHFGKSEPVENEDGGIYVKIFYLRPESSYKSCVSHPQRVCRTTKCNHNEPERTVENKRTIESGKCHTHNNNNVCRCSPCRRSDLTSNETVLSQDYNLTFHSETLGDVSKDGINHDR